MIAPTAVIGDCTLYCGNALDILPHLPPCDLLATDPPYKLTSGGKSKAPGTMSGKFSAEAYSNDGEFVPCDITWSDMASPLFRALKENADAYVMANDKNVFPAEDAFIAAGFKLHNLLAWDKVKATSNRWYMKNLEFTLYLWKGIAKTINFPDSKQGIRYPHQDVSDHPTEKPVALMRQYIRNSSQPGDIVLDPFMGSGTTGAACMELGRKFIGIEISPKFFDMARTRLERVRVQEDLFDGAA